MNEIAFGGWWREGPLGKRGSKNLSGDGLPIEVAQLGQFVGDKFPEGKET
jgi:hypothetical protein